MATDKKTAAETDVTEAAEKIEETEEIVQEAVEEAAQAEETPVKVSSKRIKKAERREAKAARKAANKIEEKKTRPNNLLIGIMIFAVVVGMFAFVLGYNYFQQTCYYCQVHRKKRRQGSIQRHADRPVHYCRCTAEGNSHDHQLQIRN